MPASATLPEALILAGGLGTRLRSVVSDRPKPMADVAGRPFLAYLVEALQAQGIRRIVFSTGYRAEQIADYFGVGEQRGVIFAYSQEATPLGTGGAVRLALPQIHTNPFLVLNGDSFCRFEVSSLLALHQRQRARATLLLAAVEDCSRYGTVAIAPDGCVEAFREKQPDPKPGLVNAGVYLLEKDPVERLPANTPASLETDLFPTLVGKGLYAIAGQNPLLDIGTPASYWQAAEFLSRSSSTQFQGT